MAADEELEGWDELDLPLDVTEPETEIIKLTVSGKDPIYLEVPADYTEDERGAYQAGLFKGIEVGVSVATGEAYQVVPTAISTRDGK